MQLRGIPDSGLRRIAQAADKYIWDFGGDVVGSSQYNGWLTAYDADTKRGLGYVEYSVFEDRYYIKMIEVAEDFKRQGIATDILNELMRREEIGIEDIDWGMTTEEGTAFRQSFG